MTYTLHFKYLSRSQCLVKEGSLLWLPFVLSFFIDDKGIDTGNLKNSNDLKSLMLIIYFLRIRNFFTM